jgi:hypothetical protein
MLADIFKQGFCKDNSLQRNVGSIRAAEAYLYSFLLQFQVLETFFYCAMVYSLHGNDIGMCWALNTEE